MDAELKDRLDRIEAKVDAAYKAAHSAQRYLFWTGVVTVVLFVVPLIGLAFAIPAFLNNYVTPMSSASGAPSATSVQGTLDTLKALGL